MRHDREFWEDRYQSTHTVWSKRPNAQLLAEVADLPPGSALDVGCGEGADAIWLAERGWRVTAVDWAVTALDRAAMEAATRGDQVADRISWQQADATGWEPNGQFDLVSSFFIHVPLDDRTTLFARLAQAVAPGGTLLIVGHHPEDLVTLPRPLPAELFFAPDEVAASLDAETWEVVVAEARPRDAKDQEGRPIQLADTVVRARKRG
jgi:SAM-dependent methyltransferase